LSIGQVMMMRNMQSGFRLMLAVLTGLAIGIAAALPARAA
jgi:hypothetical protein